MNRVRRRLCASALAAAATCVAAPGHGQHIPGAAARINDAEISNLRLERHFEEYLKNQRRHIASMINPRAYKKLKREALDQLIEREVLWQAAQADGLVVADDEVRAALQAMQAQLKTRDAFLRKLQHAGFDEQGYAEYVRRDLAGTQFLRNRSLDAPAVSEEEVAAFYRANLHRMQKPEAMLARHILIKTAPNATPEQHAAARAKADAVRADALAGSDFAELARRHSEDSTAPDGGSLGAVARGRMVKPFEDALFALAPGQVSDVVQTNAGYHLIRAEERMPAATQSMDEVRDGIRSRLQAEKRASLAREIVARLKAAARIEILVHLD